MQALPDVITKMARGGIPPCLPSTLVYAGKNNGLIPIVDLYELTVLFLKENWAPQNKYLEEKARKLIFIIWFINAFVILGIGLFRYEGIL